MHMRAASLGFYVDAGNPNSGLHVTEEALYLLSHFPSPLGAF